MAATLFRVAVACTSKCAEYNTRSMRIAATYRPSIPLDTDEQLKHRHTHQPSTPGLLKISQRDWKTHAPKPPSLIQTRSVDLEPDKEEDADETLHPGFLRKKVRREPTPLEAAAHRETIKKSFPEGWSPPHKLSRQAMEGLRILHNRDPQTFTTPVLATKFRISPEAVRRILKSKWGPSVEQRVRLARREMREKEAWIKQRRLAERRELQQLEQSRIREQLKRGHAIGANSKDSLSLV